MQRLKRNSRPGRVQGRSDDSPALTGSGIGSRLTAKVLDSHPVKDVRSIAGGKVSFDDTPQAMEGAAGAPAGPTDQNQDQAGKAGLTNGKQQQEQPPSAGDAAKGPGTQKGLFLNEEELLSRSTFPIPPGQLIDMAKDVLRAGVHKCGRLSRDFQFSAPFIGPLKPEEFASTMETLSLDNVFPDMAPRIYHMRVDPLQPNRVWFTTRPIGTNSGYLTAKLPIPVSPTGKVVELPPQTSSLTFNEKGEVIDFTMGYVMDRRLGNTGGLGGAFGFLYAIGCPFPYPEGKPWSSSWQQRLFNSGNPLLKTAMFVLDRVATALLPNWLYAAHTRNMP